MTSGKLPDGEYRFELKIFSGSSEFDLSKSDEKIETIIVETPSGVTVSYTHLTLPTNREV